MPKRSQLRFRRPIRDLQDQPKWQSHFLISTRCQWVGHSASCCGLGCWQTCGRSHQGVSDVACWCCWWFCNFHVQLVQNSRRSQIDHFDQLQRQLPCTRCWQRMLTVSTSICPQHIAHQHLCLNHTLKVQMD